MNIVGATTPPADTQVTASASSAFTRATTTADASWTITPAGGSGSYTYALQGSLTGPSGHGASLADTTTTTPDLTGIDTDGIYTFTIRVSDAADATNFFDLPLGHVYDSTLDGEVVSAAWVTVADYDFTDVTAQDVSADGSYTVQDSLGATICTLEVGVVANSPSRTANFVNGSGLEVSQTNNGGVSYFSALVDLTGYDPDEYQILVEAILTGLVYPDNDVQIGAGMGETADIVAGGNSISVRTVRTSGTSYGIGTRRYINGTTVVDPSIETSASAWTSFVGQSILDLRCIEMHWTGNGTAFFSPRGGSQSYDAGTNDNGAQAIDSSFTLTSDTLYAGLFLVSQSGTAAEMVVEHIRVKVKPRN